MIVIPMAGLSRRFREAGYVRPKYELLLGERSVFAHAVNSFRAYFEMEPFLFIVRDGLDAPAFVAREAAALGVRHVRVVTLPGETLGQADTVRLGVSQAGVAADVPLTVFNIDTFRPGFRYPAAGWFGEVDGYLEVMAGSDPGFSYVLPDGDGRVLRTAEKEVISNLASTGLYWFRRAADFMAALESGAALARGELYVAPLYNALIARGLDVRYAQVSVEDVVFCGTPAQYQGLGGAAVSP